VDETPLFRRDEIRRGVWAGDGEEARSPRNKVVEVDGGRAGHYAVEIIGEHFCGVYALASAKGAAKVVGFRQGLCVEALG
jgi:hypothetical protein